MTAPASLSAKEFRALVKKLPKRKHKYNAVKTLQRSIQGFERTYDSKKEAGHAAKLDCLILAKEIVWWLPQVTFPLPGGVKYRADFMVARANGTIAFLDVKGFDTTASKNKRKQVAALFGVEIEVV